MRVVMGDESMVEWVRIRLKDVDTFGPSIALGVVDNDRLIAAVVYHNYRQPSIEESFAADSPKWARKGIITELLSYPFQQLGCTRITGLVHQDNARSIKLTKGLGFQHEGTLRRAAEDGNNLEIFGLTLEDYIEIWEKKHLRPPIP